jgi:hypothetical protein
MNYQVGEHANWVGTARQFCTEVVIARAGHLPGELVRQQITYDLADPETGKILLFAATECEIEKQTRECGAE